MKLARFQAASRERFGIARGEHLFDLAGEIEDLTALGTLCMRRPVDARAVDDLADRCPSFPLQQVTRLIPLEGCYRVFCLALNYRGHAEQASLEVPDEPLVFLKLQSTLLDPDADIVRPPVTRKLDYEGELAVVIGSGGSHIAEEDALETVLGYTVLNDVTARDLQRRQIGSRRMSDWFSAKALDGTTPIGPYVVTADEVGDPGDLRLVTRHNGNVMQETSTSQMAAGVATVIAYLSSRVRLQPFDVIATGTPAGIGRVSDTWLEPGDVIEVEVEAVGRLTNRVTNGPTVSKDGTR